MSKIKVKQRVNMRNISQVRHTDVAGKVGNRQHDQ